MSKLMFILLATSGTLFILYKMYKDHKKESFSNP